jgi:hypothetical protein
MKKKGNSTLQALFPFSQEEKTSSDGFPFTNIPPINQPFPMRENSISEEQIHPKTSETTSNSSVGEARGTVIELIIYA